MIPMNLMDYVKIYDDKINKKLLKDTVKSLKKASWLQHTYHNAKTNQYFQTENELDISYEQIPQYDEINKVIWDTLYSYVVEDTAFTNEWFGEWTNHSLARFNKYDVNTTMKRHCDHIRTLFSGEHRGVPILTVLGLLNNDYEGGELVMFDDTIINIPAGSIIVFPSCFLYPHEVRPVTKGTRYSFVSWAW